MAIKIAGTTVIDDNKRVTGVTDDLPTIRPTLNLDFANSKTLDPRIDFTRSSTATYWDGKATAKAEENLVLYSEDITNSTGWSYGRFTLSSNVTTAPDGTSAADSVTQSDSSNGGYVKAVPLTSGSYAGQEATFSVYAKYVSQQYLKLTLNATQESVIFDIQNGTVAGNTGSTPRTSGVVDVGNGWYRLWHTSTQSANHPHIYFSDASGNTTGPTVGNVAYLWGHQVELRGDLTAYTPTTTTPITRYQPVLQTASANQPRFDHDPVTGESKGLLIEEQRTNLDAYSQQVGTWTNYNTYHVDNVAVAPDGTLTADIIVPGTSSAGHAKYKNLNTTAGVNYTWSVYVKPTKWRYFALRTTINTAERTYFDVIDGTIASQDAIHTNASIESVGNGWFRCSITFANIDASLTLELQPAGDGMSISEPGDGINGFLVWGIQVEQGAFPTSYIPTSGSQVTRGGESVELSGTNFSSWYVQDGGTFYLEAQRKNSTSDYQQILSLLPTDGSVYQSLLMQGSGAMWMYSNSGVGLYTDPANAILSDTAFSKIVFAIATDNFRMQSSVGSSIVSDTAARVMYSTRLRIASWSTRFSGHIKKLSYYPARLPNETLQAMTEE
jgi:hypothetical protein